MKIKHLLTIGLLVLITTQANATIVDGVRQKPVPKTMNFAERVEVYLYNIGAQRFFTQGNAWATQASVGEDPRKIVFEDRQEGDYVFYCYCWRDASQQGGFMSEGWRNVFFDSETAVFVDRNNQPNYFWDVEQNSDGSFRILPSSNNPTINQQNYPGMYLGLDVADNTSNTALSSLLYPGDDHYIDWIMVSQDDYMEYSKVLKVYEMAQVLKGTIDNVKALGGDASSVESVYLNENSTLEELQTAIEEAKVVFVQALIDNAEDRNNVDVTMLLNNPDFEQGETGWTVIAASGSGPNGRQGNVRPGGSASNQCYEAWNNSSFDIYQIVEKAPVGVYEIAVQGFYRYGRDNTAWNAYLDQKIDYVKPSGIPVYVYLNDNPTNFTNVYGDPKQITDESFYSIGSNDYVMQTKEGTNYFFPNGMASAAIAFSDGMYKQSAFGLVAFEGDKLRLGVKGNSSQLNDSWVIWDNFKLTYRGFAPEVIKPVLEEAIAEVKSTYIGLLMGKTEYAAFTNAMTKADEAIKNNDGEKMFEALRELYEAKDPALASKDIFLAQEVAGDTARLAQAIRDVAEAKMANATREKANALLYGLQNNLIYENDQIGQLKYDVDDMLESLSNSKTLYAQLNEANERLQTAITEVKSKTQHVSKTILDNANTLMTNSKAAYNDGSMNDEDVPTNINNINIIIEELTKSVKLYEQMTEAIQKLDDFINDVKKEALVSESLIKEATELLATTQEQYAANSFDNEQAETRLQEIDDMIKRLEAAIDELYFEVYPLMYHITSLEEHTVEVFECNLFYEGELTIPETVTHNEVIYTVTGIAPWAFKDCYEIIKVICPETVKSIGDGAFEGARSLTYVYVPWGVTYMGTGVFSGCTSLGGINFGGTMNDCVIEEGTITYYGPKVYDITSVTLPSTLKYIGEGAFNLCFHLMTVISEIEDLFEINDNTFSDVTYQFAVLVVPDGMVEVYRSTPGWKNFKNIIEASSFVTGIDKPNVSGQMRNEVYTVGGKKVTGSLRKGLYIQNHKKVVVK